MICSVNPVVMHAILPLSKLQSYRRLAADSFFIDMVPLSFRTIEILLVVPHNVIASRDIFELDRFFIELDVHISDTQSPDHKILVGILFI